MQAAFAYQRKKMLSVDVFHDKSRNGYPLDVLVSALQKSIRRNEFELAARVAYELSISSSELENHVWHRLLVISAEDIGSGNFLANTIVKNLYDSSLIFCDEPGRGDRLILMMHAIRFLCRQDKDRCSCLYADIVKREKEEISFPDYVYDMHTTKGMELKRKFDFFLDEASKVSPACNVEEEEQLKEKLRSLLRPEDH